MFRQAKQSDIPNPEPQTLSMLPQWLIDRLQPLYPDARDRLIAFFEDCHKAGLYFYPLKDPVRTWLAQDSLYAIGRTTELTRKRVTDAKGGESWHNYNVAIDGAFDADLTRDGVQWDWDTHKYKWSDVAEIAKKHGLTWGGSFDANKKVALGDLGHYHISYGLTIHEAQEIYKLGGLAAVWREFDKKRGI